MNAMKHLSRIVALLFALCAALLAGCERTPDEVVIRETIDAMVAAVERREPKPVLEKLAQDFRGPEDIDARQVRQILAAQFFRNPNIRVVLAGMKIEVLGIDATARFKAFVTGGEQLLPQRADYYDVTLEWRKRDGDWQIVRALWEPAFNS
jgi:hypothetical protein